MEMEFIEQDNSINEFLLDWVDRTNKYKSNIKGDDYVELEILPGYMFKNLNVDIDFPDKNQTEINVKYTYDSVEKINSIEFIIEATTKELTKVCFVDYNITFNYEKHEDDIYEIYYLADKRIKSRRFNMIIGDIICDMLYKEGIYNFYVDYRSTQYE